MSSSMKLIDTAMRNFLASFGRMAATMPNQQFSGHDGETLALGSLVGIRYWSLTTPIWDDAGQPAVRLKGARGQWAPGMNTATCLDGGGLCAHDGAIVPARNCHCGFWAYWAEDPQGGHQYMSFPDVAGVIEGQGRYVGGTLGFRCQKAKILAVCVQDTGRGEHWRVFAEQALIAEYQVPVYCTVATMLKAFPPSRQPQKPPSSGGVSAGGAGGGGGGNVYVPGPPLAHATVRCLCGVIWNIAGPGPVICGCGRRWNWDGLTQPVMLEIATPAVKLQQLEQKKDPPS